MIDVQWLERKSYKPAWDYQLQLVDDRLNGRIEDTLVLCEHNHVYTFGKSANRNNLLIQPDFLKHIGAETFEIERGGDITYHGPGQLVGYPIINLHKHRLGVRTYVDLIEESLILCLLEFGIEAKRIEGLTGIWIDDAVPRKIAAIGIKITRGITMHGFALNVNTDLSYYNHIVPCGIQDKGVTSIEKELEKPMEMKLVVDIYSKIFERLIGSKSNKDG